MLRVQKSNETSPNEIQKLQSLAEEGIKSYSLKLKSELESAGLSNLFDGIAYSLFSGGNRFRPTVCLLTARALNADLKNVLPLAIAVELIHTYSLIHDDLPSMDNDDFRRGKPSTHKVFGEDRAILLGDALQAEAFKVLAVGYQDRPEVLGRLVLLLSTGIGPLGLVGGQFQDISSRGKELSQDEVTALHSMKTGRLFEMCFVGSAIASEADPEKLALIGELSKQFGLLFQICDDLKDAGQSGDEPSFLKGLTEPEARAFCGLLISRIIETGKNCLGDVENLQSLVDSIYERTVTQ